MPLPWEYHRDVYMASFDMDDDRELVHSYIILRKNMSGWCKVKLINITRIDGEKVTMTDYDLRIHNEGNSSGSGHYMTPEYTARLKGNVLTVFMGDGTTPRAYLENEYEWDGKYLNALADSDSDSDEEGEDPIEVQQDPPLTPCPSSSSMPRQSHH